MFAASTPFFPAYASKILLNFVVGFTCISQTGFSIPMPLAVKDGSLIAKRSLTALRSVADETASAP